GARDAEPRDDPRPRPPRALPRRRRGPRHHLAADAQRRRRLPPPRPGGGRRALAGAPLFRIIFIASAAAASSSKPIATANRRPMTCAMRNAMLIPASASARAISAPQAARRPASGEYIPYLARGTRWKVGAAESPCSRAASDSDGTTPP